MDISDRLFVTNRDWDSQYLRELVTQDFYDFKEHWQSSVMSDKELIVAERQTPYCPVTEDISIDDATLYEAVAQIEDEWVLSWVIGHISML